ncbi:AAA domain-containing protein [Pseudomonas mosselii]|uniref:Protein kinase domain-containing protein n=1 Tax=Pseudomonas mosselii TaxID=78327 RepID=A0ABX9B910_9PSED|nr:AAA domain-containing protein [Pseudomonas mosselii]MDH1510862.1 AAA domain-containing protein [Pseudomonas mosselii]QZP28484.1 hypothetical protein K5H97_09115 [Pseudomonas mosselii]
MSQGNLTLKKTAKSSALSGYTLEKKYLCTFNKSTGSPSQRNAVDEHGSNVLIKTWPRNPNIDDKDIYEVWKNETRQLYRLAGFPGISNYIAELKTALIDETGYHLVIKTEQRQPLEILIRNDDYTPTKNPRSTRNRRLSWANLHRISKGLEILHLQGLLHRNLNNWSILTSNTDEPDFQLTGFEWSMRLVEPEKHSNKTPPHSYDNTHSFIKDWQQLGEIAATLLGVPYTKLINLGISNHEVSDGISADEIKLIRELQGYVKTDRIDGKYVITKIDKILLELDSELQNKEHLYSFFLSLGPESKAATTIRQASKNQIEIDDEEEQLDFIKKDLRTPIFQAMKSNFSSTGLKYCLRGELLTYTIDAFQKRGAPASWDLAYCSSIEPSNKVPNPIIYQIPLSGSSLNTLPLTEAKRAARLKGRTTSWTSLTNKASLPEDPYSEELKTRKSLILSQILDYLFAASEAYPVSIIREPKQAYTPQLDGTISIKITARTDTEREELCRSLKIRDNLARRLEKSLIEDRIEGGSGNWILTDSPNIGERSDMDTEWQFHSHANDKDGRKIYTFTGDNPPNTSNTVYLISADSAGRDLQLRRRLKSFTALGEHNELARMICDPRGRIMSSHEQIVEDAAYLSLDTSKQDAFKSIIETLPLFLVQGPPGVGKTRLVRELVSQIISNDSSSRILLSAQSNHAVDHLMQEIKDIVSDSNDAIIIRCVQKSAKDAEKRFDIGYETRSIVNRIADSDLISTAPKELAEKLTQLTAAYNNDTNTPISTTLEISKNSIENLVLRSANLVFATTNSAALEGLIEEKNQFDWSIIEEAGKATGGELTSPLLLSPRRLMIGDHKQLPPFGADRILKILSNPADTKNALESGNLMIGRHFRDPIVDEIFSDAKLDNGSEEAASDFSDLCDEAAKNFLLFESTIENEFDRQKRRNKGFPIAKSLHHQHRMHPEIAELVSHAFYKEDLKTDPSSALRFEQNPSPIRHSNGNIPDLPIVWIDMPWVSSTLDKKYGDKIPHYTNPDEIDVIEIIIKQLTAASDNSAKPTIAILSPYSRQTREIANRIEAKKNNDLANIHNFSSAAGDGSYCSTVDSFQGNEADCVIISLVRNNSHSTIYNALGFLADSRRMNVLMSRAKWRLVLVGSLDFLKSIHARPKGEPDRRQIDFLSKLIRKIESNRDVHKNIVPAKVLEEDKF